MRMPIRISTM